MTFKKVQESKENGKEIVNGQEVSVLPVSYTHLTLPTNREV